MKRFLLWLPFAIATAACSSSGGVAPRPSEGTVPSETSEVGAADAQVADASSGAVDGCTEEDFAANDHTAESDPRIIQAPLDKEPVQFSPHCMRVRVEQVVTWQGALAEHSLRYVLSADGEDAGAFNATVGAPDGSPDVDTVTAHQPGKIVFTCTDHPSIMFGVVQVVPWS